MCPIHFAKLEDGDDWHALHCPRGHPVDRDAAAVLNMLWKITPEGVVKGVWWDMKEVRKRLKKGRGLVPKEAMRRRNPLVTWPVVCAVLASLRSLKASPQWPAVLARAAPMTPAQGAYEGGTRAPVNRPSGRGGGQPGGRYAYMSGTFMATPHVTGVVALIQAVRSALGLRPLTPDEMNYVLTSTAKDIGPPGFDVFSGYGLVDAYAAVNAALKIG